MKLSFLVFCLSYLVLMNTNSSFFQKSFIDIGGLNIRIPDLIFILMWTMASFELFLKKEIKIKKVKLSQYYIFFLIWILISSFMIAPIYGTPIINGSLSQVRKLIYYSVFFLVLFIFHKRQDIKLFMKLFILFGLITSLRMITEYFYLSHKSSYELIRIVYNVTLGSAYSQIIFFFCLGLISFVNSKRFKINLIIISIVCLFAMLVTFSRGIILTTFISVVIYFFLIGKISKFLKSFILINLIILFIYLLIPSNIKFQLKDRFVKGFGDLQMAIEVIKGKYDIYSCFLVSEYTDLSLIRKLIEYKLTFEEFKKSPIWGVGLGYEYEKYWGGEEKFKKSSYVHSVYNYFLMDTGLIGLSLFLFLIFKIGKLFLTLFKFYPDNFYKGIFLGCFLSLIALAINSFNGSFLLSIPYIMFITTFSALGELLKNERTASTQIINIFKYTYF